MPPTAYPRIPHRAASAVLLASYLVSCTSWQRQARAPRDVVERLQPSVVRVSLADGSTQLIHAPRVERDSLIGYLSFGPRTGVRDRRAVPADSVSSVALRTTDTGRTALLLTGAGLSVMAIIALAMSGGEAPPPPPTSQPVFVSCPLVYSWDGTQWRLDSGTFGGAIMPALARTDVDNLVHATAQQGSLRLRMANELNETDYVDAVSVLAVDHDPATTVAPSADGIVHALGPLQAPSAAVDGRGHDALDRVRTADGRSWESRPSGRDPRRAADVRDGLDLTFDRPRGATTARLVVDGSNTPWAAFMVQEFISAHGRGTQAWYDSVAAHPAMARQLGAMMAREGFLDVQVRVAGRWVHRDFVWESGPEVSKRQVVVLDLDGVEGNVVEIRLESAPMFWLIDAVALDYSTPAAPRTRELHPESARDHMGRDVRAALRSVDRSHHVLVTGDHTDLSFEVPPVPAGLARSYMLRSTGWYRINSDTTRAPDVSLLQEVERPRGASRVSVGRFNDALRLLGEAPR